MPRFNKQSGTSIIEILITFTMIGFCLIALTKSQLLVDHGYQDLIMRTQAINQAVNLAEVFATDGSSLQQQQDIALLQASRETQAPDLQMEFVTNGQSFSVTMSWMASIAYSIPCNDPECDGRETMMLQGWMAAPAG